MLHDIVQLLGTPTFVIALVLGLAGYAILGIAVLVGIYIVVRVIRAAWFG